MIILISSYYFHQRLVKESLNPKWKLPVVYKWFLISPDVIPAMLVHRTKQKRSPLGISLNYYAKQDPHQQQRGRLITWLKTIFMPVNLFSKETLMMISQRQQFYKDMQSANLSYLASIQWASFQKTELSMRYSNKKLVWSSLGLRVLITLKPASTWYPFSRQTGVFTGRGVQLSVFPALSHL